MESCQVRKGRSVFPDGCCRSAPAGDSRRGLTVLELLVVLAIVGVLLGLVLPALNAARESARKLTCSHNLRQLGIALHSYHDVFAGLPAGWQRESSGRSAFGWASGILTFIEQEPLDQKVDRTRSIDAAENLSACRQSFPMLLCPSDNAPARFELFADQGTVASWPPKVLARLPGANYVGIFGTLDPDTVDGRIGNGAFLEGRSIRMAEFQRGLSQSLLVGERTAQRLTSTWIGFVIGGEDAPGRVAGGVILGPNRRDADECEFDSRHPGSVNFLWGDAGVRSISDSIDSAIYRRFARRDDVFE
ncbi:MAG TPA: DUF1559 domain-containing protein [Planctomycetaceae bacterium]|nr:DUF1559 domain-containing protein [Planctomycetaceae bacterium]